MSTCVVCECESSILFCSRGGDNRYVSCTSCGHVYERHIENTFETEKAIDKKATHHISGPKQQWDFSEIKKSQVFRPRLVTVGKYTAPGKLLDVGCSNGAFIEAANAYGWDASGVELRESSASFAQARGLKVYTQPLQDLQLAKGSFDTITLWQVLEHIPDPPDLLNECGRLMRTGGTVAFSTPNIKSIGWKLLKSDWPAIEPGCHHHLFGCRTIDMLMKKCGFERCVLETLDI
jgi:2-polyprenyl-3-methyl-5-hydroxy-6-metoxy-1,4-benzoquinol methylase